MSAKPIFALLFALCLVGLLLFPLQTHADGITPTPTQEEAPVEVTIQYIGHSSFLITAPDGTRVVTDPYHGVGYRFPKDLEADVVLISHMHSDHANVRAVKGSPAIFFGLPGDFPNQVGMVEINGFEARHGKHNGQDMGPITIFVLHIGDIKIVHLSELGEIESPEVFAEIADADVVMMTTGVVGSLPLDEIMPLMDRINARTIIPEHYSVDGYPSFYGSATLGDFLAVLPDDLPVIRADELVITPGMPRQVAALWPLGAPAARPSTTPAQEE